MIYLNFLGQHFVVLSSLEAISDLFEKRSTIYSDRMQTTMLHELYVSHSFYLKVYVQNADRCRMDWSINFALMPYGVWWRRHRRLFHEYFHRNAVKKYQPIKRQEVQAFLRRLLVTPDDFFRHIRQ